MSFVQPSRVAKIALARGGPAYEILIDRSGFSAIIASAVRPRYVVPRASTDHLVPRDQVAGRASARQRTCGLSLGRRHVTPRVDQQT
jgi:hypothetical protein